MNSGTSINPHYIADCLSATDYRRLADFIHASSGIKMPSSKKTFLEGRLRKRLRLRGYESFDEYCHYLFDEGGLFEEETALIDAVTTNKTDFFREPHHFDFLIREGLPRLVDRGLGIHHPLRVWSAGLRQRRGGLHHRYKLGRPITLSLHRKRPDCWAHAK